MLVDGVTVEYRRPDGSIAGRRRGSSTSTSPTHNDWLAVNQFTVVEGQHTRRPDVVLFVNGLPLAVIELKNAADENATIWTRVPPAPDLPGRRSRRCSPTTRCWSSPTACRRASARSAPAGSGSSRGGRSTGEDAAPTRPARAAGAARGRVRAAPLPRPGPRTSSCSRTTAAARSPRRWPATTSSTP